MSRPQIQLELVDVSASNWEACVRLRVKPDQRPFVEEVAYYLCMCHYGGVWRPLAAEVGGQIVGFAMWGIDDDGSRWIGGVLVDAAQQGRGIGRTLMGALVERLAPEAGDAGLALSYRPDNVAARGLYASLGFVETGEREGEELVARRF